MAESEVHIYVCRPCRVGATVLYILDTIERLPEHGLCPDCDQPMELRGKAREAEPVPEPLDAMDAKRIIYQWGKWQAEIDQAVAAGNLKVYGPSEEPHYFEDEVRACFGPPLKSWKRRDAQAAGPGPA